MLRRIQTDDSWPIVLKALGQRMDELAAQASETGGTTAYESLKTLHKAQGGRDALIKFFNDLETGAFE